MNISNDLSVRDTCGNTVMGLKLANTPRAARSCNNAVIGFKCFGLLSHFGLQFKNPNFRSVQNTNMVW